MNDATAIAAASRSDRGIGYIAAIDGLRAIAVLSVMLFHLRPALLPGGFVGVDIFFVISGFVVTSSLAHARFARFGDLLRFFYARRLFRIMPALIAMLTATLILSAMFIPDAWLSDSIYLVGRDAYLGLSNVRLALQTEGYFAPRESFNPFLHTWSLGVEEQFYLLFPFVMWLKLRRDGSAGARRAEVAVIGALSAASLVACAALSLVAWRYAFYSIPARFWELGTGMILSLTLDRWRPRVAALERPARAALTAAAGLLLGVSFAIGESLLFPFPLALLPAAGAALLIVLVARSPEGRPARLLSTAPSVAIGRLSYSLYLWHWPVFVLMRWTWGLAGVLPAAAALVLVFALSWLSYMLVERPMRRFAAGRSRASPGRLVLLALAATLLAAAGARILIPHRALISLSVTRDRALWQADEIGRLFPHRARCALRRSEEPLGAGTLTSWTPTGCTGGGGRRLFVVGDSHSLAMRPLALQYAAEQAVTVRSAFLSGCNFMNLYEPLAARPACPAFTAAVVRRVLAEARPGDIVFMPSLRIPRLYGQGGALPAEPPPTARDRAIAFVEARRLVEALAPTGARLMIEAPLPVFRTSPFRCSDWFNRRNPDCAGGDTVPAALIGTMRAPVLAAAQALARRYPAASLWDPLPIVCPGSACSAVVDGRPVFFDGDHLSNFGNRMLYSSFAAHLGHLSAPPAAVR